MLLTDRAGATTCSQYRCPDRLAMERALKLIYSSIACVAPELDVTQTLSQLFGVIDRGQCCSQYLKLTSSRSV